MEPSQIFVEQEKDKSIRVLYLSGIPAPYRVDLFNEMGKTISLTVAFLAEYQSERNQNWQSSQPENFRAVFLNNGALNGKRIDLSMVKFLKKHANEFDIIVVHGYSFVASILAISWMNKHGIKYGIEADGAIIPESENAFVSYLKKYCIKNASFCLSSGKATTDFFVHFGADRQKCYLYPFSSINSNDIVRAHEYSKIEKKIIRKQLNITESKVILITCRLANSVFEKGYDILMRVAERINDDVGIYFIVDESIQELIDWKESKNLSNVHFVDFLDRNNLYHYYACADLFILFNQVDDCELAINEAMIFGLPIVTTRECLAGLNLVQNGVNGCIVNIEDEENILKEINDIMQNDIILHIYSENCLKRIYTCNLNSFYNAHNDAIVKALSGERQIHQELARNMLHIDVNEKMILYVGQMIYRKGIDVLLNSIQLMSNEYKFYMIGQEKDTSYMNMAKSLGLNNIQFYSFMSKDQLRVYYQAADIFVLPTREDIWGLVINESLNFGLPVISTRGCVAACEMLPEKCIVNVADADQLAQSIKDAFRFDVNTWQEYSLEKTMEYSIDNSSKVHIGVFLREMKN